MLKAWRRIRILLTGNVEWVDDFGGLESEKLSWRTRWAMFGVHSYMWGWVQRYGALPCGCTINPITRRRGWTDMDCKVHAWWWGEGGR